MLYRDRYLLKQITGFFLVLFVSFSLVLLITQVFWSFADARHAGIFPWKDYIINFYDNLRMAFPFISLLSAFFVFAEMERFRQISVLELKGISELQIFRAFLMFGFFISFFAFVFGCFPPYPEANKVVEGDISITTPVVSLYAERTDRRDILVNVVISLREGESEKIIHAGKAHLLEDRIILYNGIVFGAGNRNFSSLIVKTSFNPLLLERYTSISSERQSFFFLRKVLKNMAAVGVMSRTDWIMLYSKLSYPLLNVMVMFLLLPFFYQRKVLSRIKIFITGFILMFFTYVLYSAGLSLGKAEIIPWQISPWISHVCLLSFYGIYLSSGGKRLYNLWHSYRQ